MLPDEKKEIVNSTKIVVRLLNGLLRGCEFTLFEGNTLFLVTEENAVNEQHKGSVLPDNTIYIPAEQAESNFEIVVSDDETECVFLREMREESALGRIIAPNVIHYVGSLAFAWRHEHEHFTDTILNGVENDKLVENASLASDDKPASKSRWYAWTAIILIVGVLAVAGYVSLTQTQRQIDSVAALLDFAPDDYQIVYGHDKSLYIFAKNDKATDWAVQTLIRTPPRQHLNVVNVITEAERIGRWIESHWPTLKFHQIRLDDPRKPVIRVSKERTALTEKEKNVFIENVKKHFPYADAVIIEYLEDNTLKAIAEQGLKKMAPSYRVINTGDSITFVILGVIEDGMLENIKNYVNQYYQQWGERYVHFSVELKTDWFKDKSFKFGEQGYIKLGAGHWFFPNNPYQE